MGRGREKASINVQDPGTIFGVRTYGTGENRRHIYTLKVFSGPHGTTDRDVELLMTDEEMLKLALKFLGSCPMGMFDGNAHPAELKKLEKYLTMFKTSATNPVEPPVVVVPGDEVDNGVYVCMRCGFRTRPHSLTGHVSCHALILREDVV